MEASIINLKKQYIAHKTFGRGQIIEQGTDFVKVLFTKSKEEKKFIYPSAIETFLKLEDAETAKLYKEYTDQIALNNAEEQKDAAERAALAKKAVDDHAKALKKAQRKPAKKQVKKEPEPEEET